MAKNTELVVEIEESKPKSPPNFFALFPKIDLSFPFLNQPPKREGKVKEEEPKRVRPNDGEIESKEGSITRVSFPKAEGKVPGPLEFEAEDSVGRTSNPLVLWQVYAIGGFLVLKWVWSRWNERKERGTKKEPSNEDRPPTGDEDSYN